jgi:hypothetical protein
MTDPFLSTSEVSEGRRLLGVPTVNVTGRPAAAHAPWAALPTTIPHRRNITNPLGPISRDLSDANAEAIVWLRNNADRLLAAADLAASITEASEHGKVVVEGGEVVGVLGPEYSPRHPLFGGLYPLRSLPDPKEER